MSQQNNIGNSRNKYISKRSPQHNKNNNRYNNIKNNNPLLQQQQQHSPSQQFHDSSLRMNRTQSQNSSQGNTIDMVRLVNKREQNRISRVNNYRDMYAKYYNNKQDKDQQGNSNNKKGLFRKYCDQKQRQMEMVSLQRGRMNNNNNRSERNDNNININSNRNNQQQLQTQMYYQQPQHNIPTTTNKNTGIRHTINNSKPLTNNNPLSPSPTIINPRHSLPSTNIKNTFLSRSAFRPSQFQLLKQSDQYSSRRNRVIGWLLVIVYVLMYLQIIFVCGWVLNQGYVSYCFDGDSRYQQRIKVYDHDNNNNNNNVVKTTYSSSSQSSSTPTSTMLFTTVLLIYALSQCLYHLIVYMIDNKNSQTLTNNNNNNPIVQQPLIDKQTSSIEYILHCRDFSKSSSSMVQNIVKSPKFILLIIIFLTMLICYGCVQCFYNIQYKYFYWGVDNNISNQSDKYCYSVLQVIFYLVILPDVMGYLFFQMMHVVDNGSGDDDDDNDNRRYSLQKKQQVFTSGFEVDNINNGNDNNRNDNNHNTLYSNNNNNIKKPLLLQQQQYYLQSHLITPPLTQFNTDKWWMRLSLIILVISIIYSLVYHSKYWLMIVCLGRIQLLFVKAKYRIDTFWVELIGKIILLIVSIVWYCYGCYYQQKQLQMGLNTFTFIGCVLVVTVSLLLARVLAGYYIKQQLYHYLFSQSYIVMSTIILSILINYAITCGLIIQVDWLSVVIVVMMEIGLVIAINKQSQAREDIYMNDYYYQHNQLQSVNQQRQAV